LGGGGRALARVVHLPVAAATNMTIIAIISEKVASYFVLHEKTAAAAIAAVAVTGGALST
jgi:hypothetical protein